MIHYIYLFVLSTECSPIPEEKNKHKCYEIKPIRYFKDPICNGHGRRLAKLINETDMNIAGKLLTSNHKPVYIDGRAKTKQKFNKLFYTLGKYQSINYFKIEFYNFFLFV